MELLCANARIWFCNFLPSTTVEKEPVLQGVDKFDVVQHPLCNDLLKRIAQMLDYDALCALRLTCSRLRTISADLFFQLRKRIVRCEALLYVIQTATESFVEGCLVIDGVVIRIKCYDSLYRTAIITLDSEQNLSLLEPVTKTLGLRCAVFWTIDHGKYVFHALWTDLRRALMLLDDISICGEHPNNVAYLQWVWQKKDWKIAAEDVYAFYKV